MRRQPVWLQQQVQFLVQVRDTSATEHSAQAIAPPQLPLCLQGLSCLRKAAPRAALLVSARGCGQKAAQALTALLEALSGAQMAVLHRGRGYLTALTGQAGQQQQTTTLLLVPVLDQAFLLQTLEAKLEQLAVTLLSLRRAV